MMADVKALEHKLTTGLKQLKLELTTSDKAKLLRHLQLLEQWGSVYNLTGLKNMEDMIVRHVFDSLSIAPDIGGSNVADVGTGAGFPGIPLALVYPRKHFVLLDSREKKIRFIEHVIRELQLENVQVLKCRVEDFQPTTCFDTVVCRAFGNLAEIVQKMSHLCCNKGYILCMKGRYPQQELEMIQDLTKNVILKQLSVPDLQAERYVVKIVMQTNEA